MAEVNEGVPTPVIVTMVAVTVVAAAIIAMLIVHFCAQAGQVPVMWQ